MPCGSCGHSQLQNQELHLRQRWQLTASPFDPDCPYTEEVLENWRTKLLCIKTEGLLDKLGITEAQIHAHIGIVISSINYYMNRCRFRTELEKVEPIIYKLAELNLCQ